MKAEIGALTKQWCQVSQSMKCQIQDEKKAIIVHLFGVPQKIECQTLNKMFL